MKILNPNTTTQTVKIIPRLYVQNVSVSVYNENTGAVVNFGDVSVSSANGYSTFTIELQPKNEHHFVITVKDGAQQIYKCKAYAKE